MTDKKQIDIPRPGFAWKKELIGFVGFAVLVAAVTGFIIYQKKTSEPDNSQHEQYMVQQGLDPDFFSTAEPAPKPEPEPEAPIVKMDLTPPAPKPEPVKKPTAKELFKLHKAMPANDNKILNNRRRGIVEVNVKASAPDMQSSTVKEIPEGKWKEAKTNASLPLDMSRVVSVDKFIPALIVNQINSELGGKVVAQIEENVFGGHGRKILIPAGSKAVGRYKPVKKIGQERLTVTWVRIITPDGINIHVGNAEMADAMGRSGITGDVDRRYGERYGMSLLVSVLTAATTYSLPVKNQNQQVVIESFGKEQSGLAQTILEEHLDIQPRIEIQAGSRILISAAKDIWFKDVGNNNMKVLPVGG